MQAKITIRDQTRSFKLPRVLFEEENLYISAGLHSPDGDDHQVIQD